MATTCNTCRYFNPESRVCGMYDLPATHAREMPAFCGDAGVNHRRVPATFADRMDWIVVAVLVIALAVAAVLS